MNPIDDDTLQAYVDGELDASELARVEAAIALDATLEARVQQARALRTQLQAAFAPVLDEPVPARLSALLGTESTGIPASAMGRRAAHGFGAGRRRAPRRWLAMAIGLAASLAIVAVGLSWRPGGGPIGLRDGQRVASGALSEALDQALASEPDPGAAVVIGLTFRKADGHICRTFIHRPKPAIAGLACHGDAGWAVAAVSDTDAHEGELRQAASGLPESVQAAVDAALHGDAFDASEERAARDAGWR